MSSQDATPAVMDRVTDMIRDRLAEPEAELVDAFVRQYYARVDPDDLAHLDAVDVYGAALSHWSLAQQPPAGAARVRVYNPRFDEHGWQTTHTVVEVHVEDMPFLVDSVGMELVRHGLDIPVVIHPVIRLRRNDRGEVVEVLEPGRRDPKGPGVSAESFIHVEVDRQGDPEILAQIERDLTSVLADVRAAVEDWPKMLQAVDRVTAQLDENPPPVPEQELDEAKALLAWLADNHFTFLGFREYELVSEDGEDQLRAVPDTGLGILRGAALRSASFAKVPPEVRQLARQKDLLNITKANSMATVHRPTRLDYVGVKRFDDTGEPVGEWRFLGLYTSTLYSISVTQIPVLRRKVDAVMDRAGFEAASHDAKDLLTILEQYPRDELLQIDEDQLYDTAMGILGLQERQRLRVFVRRERFGRYFSCLVFLPRDRLNTDNRVAIQRILLDELDGISIEYQSRLSESVLARIHFIVRIEPGSSVDYDAAAIERRVAQAIRSWNDDLSDALIDEFGEHRGVELFHRYREAFPAAYRADFPARMGAVDIRRIEDAFDRDLALHAHHPLEAPPNFVRLKLFHSGQPITISDVLPVFENLGVKVVDERPYEIRPEGTEPVWIYDFGLSTAHVSDEPIAEPLRELAEEAFARVWRGEAENDGFNRLVLAAGLPWRDVTVLRAYSKYLRQTGQTFSQEYMERTLAAHPHIAQLLVELFRARFDPTDLPPASQRRATADELTRQLLYAIDAVASLDEDRILRSFLGLVLATVRTNAFQSDGQGRPKGHLAFKFDPALIDDLPSPRPMFEIFVYSPRTEGVHLRGGKVARGGLRWSDRREDFRREVLGLMRAQMVKNAVIVPAGAKGGFVVKRPPADRPALADEVAACYSTFVRGLLDLTDNLVGGKVVPPPDVVRHDVDDPYLVVAADKGTAAFSDVANEISAEYGFWLGDAFASGGSTGYDHKRMGITARGAFESVKRHFRQLGVNVETTEITAVGIGDMSGDVFGNGMLLFPHLKLVGAFDHRHIFLDPDPDPEAAARERERLFRLPGSTWADYDAAVLSQGGGVYPRTAKMIPLSPEIRQRLAIEDETATPHEVIWALLKAPVDLLWNGAIGTFVKASSESHAEVGDKANDAVRVDARELRCRVVAEGGNLGFTQQARIEFARAGGLVNTDFIDNSGGVDCSDREVNIKILLDGEVAAGDLTRKQRDRLLAEMTDEVADLVLRDNYLQAQALARTVASTRQRGPRYLGLLRSAEQAGRVGLRRDAGTTGERSPAAEMLTVPELAVLFAHTKIMLYDALLASDVPDDPYMARELVRYFPTPLRERFAAGLRAHPLRREIVANTVANEVVNRLDFTATFTVADHMAATLVEIARAFTVVCEILGLRRLWDEVEALDDRVPMTVQTEMVGDIGRVLTSLMRWLLRHRPPPIDVAAEVARFADQVTALAPALRGLLAPKDRQRCEGRAAQFVGEGVPAGLAEEVAWLGAVMPAPDLVEVAAEVSEPAETVAAVHAGLCERLRLEWLREEMDALPFATRWQTLSRLGVRDELFDHRRALTAAVLRAAPPGQPPPARLDAWLAANPVAAARFRRLVAEIDRTGTCDMTTLTVALSELRNLVTNDRLG